MASAVSTDSTGTGDAAWSAIRVAIEALSSRKGTRPSILDWSGAFGFAANDPDMAVVHPPVDCCTRLSYLDDTIDLVVVGGDDPDRVGEAGRVASRCVVRLGSDASGEPTAVVEWQAPPTSAMSVSILIPTYRHAEATVRCLLALERTIPSSQDVEILVVDDASGDDTAEAAALCGKRNPRIRVLQNATNLGFVGTCNRAAAEASGDLLLFLNQDTEPLPGWLPPLVWPFASSDPPGAVGCKLLFPDGMVQEAGGVVFGDGSCANFGRGLPPDDPLVEFVREVDYCSAAALATPRVLFRDLGGFDGVFRPAYYEDTDYCMRVREQGRSVLYQPASVVVHDEGSAHGTDPSRGGKRHQNRNRQVFARRWSSAIAGHPTAPARYDLAAWHALVHRDWGR